MATVNGILSPPLRPDDVNTPLSAKRKREDSNEDNPTKEFGDSNSAKTINDTQALIKDLVDVLKS